MSGKSPVRTNVRFGPFQYVQDIPSWIILAVCIFFMVFFCCCLGMG